MSKALSNAARRRADAAAESDALDAAKRCDGCEDYVCSCMPSCCAETPEQCGQCGAEVIGHHACQGVPGGFGEDGAP